jgi:MOSC domain-containing protein YiiM
MDLRAGRRRDARHPPPARSVDPVRLLSVNVGTPVRLRTPKGREVRTAIWKQPVEGRVAVRGVNVDGDRQADLRVHGGPDKAVYAYASEDTASWEQELGRELGPGAFGENLTTEGVDVTNAVIGERWAIGTTVLEVCQPRLPCFKLGLRFDDPKMVRRFGEARRPGAYLRIVSEGELGAGDPIDVGARPAHGVTIALVSEAILHDETLLPRLLDAPELADDLRDWVKRAA